MHPALSRSFMASAAVGLLLAPACGGGDGTPPVAVATVVITAPAAAPNFGAFGRTVQFTAQARDAAGGAISGAAISWSSSSPAVASVSGSGLVTALANGFTQITAASGGQTSAVVLVTVAQVPVAIAPTPATVTFGAIGKTRQLAAAVTDSGGAAVTTGTLAWTRAGPGTVASVSATGLATALTAGTGDTAVATAGSLTARIPITVAQVTTAISVTSTSATPDTLVTTTRTRQFTATARDSNNNAIGSAAFSWSSNAGNIAGVDGAGLVTAGAADGSATIQASSSGVNGTRTMVVRHYPSTFTLAPPSASITTNGGTQPFNGTAQDSVGTTLTINWSSKNTAIASVTPATGASTTAHAAGNGSTHVVMASGARRDSAALTVSNQVLPTMASVTVGDDFFKSVRNNSQNPAVDTVSAGGQVTWTFAGALQHSVRSQGNPSFTSSAIMASGTYSFTFNTPGSYQYDCAVHGSSMSGTVVVQ